MTFAQRELLSMGYAQRICPSRSLLCANFRGRTLLITYFCAKRLLNANFVKHACSRRMLVHQIGSTNLTCVDFGGCNFFARRLLNKIFRARNLPDTNVHSQSWLFPIFLRTQLSRRFHVQTVLGTNFRAPRLLVTRFLARMWRCTFFCTKFAQHEFSYRSLSARILLPEVYWERIFAHGV